MTTPSRSCAGWRHAGQQIVGAGVAFAFDDAGHAFISDGDFGSYSIEIETVTCRSRGT